MAARRLVYGPKTLLASTTEFTEAFEVPVGATEVAAYGKCDNGGVSLDAASGWEWSFDGGVTWQTTTAQFTVLSNDLTGVAINVNWGVATLGSRRNAGSDLKHLVATHVRFRLTTAVGQQLNNLRVEIAAF